VSGILCGIKVRLRDQTQTGVSPLVMAEHVDIYGNNDYRNAGGQGDSGGPLFSLPSPDNGKVIAKGMMSRGGGDNYRATCTGKSVSGRQCWWRVYLVDLVQALGWYNATIVTG
jgi:hypothetical protein